MAERLCIDPNNATFEELAPAARILLDGGVVACPTESFYALTALVDDHGALERIIRLKGESERENKPLLIMVDNPARVMCYAREIPEEAEGLMARFWPGLMTLLFLAHSGIHQALVGPARTVGVRVEGLACVRRLVRMADRGLTGTSANPAGLPPASSADEVLHYFGDDIEMVIDGGPGNAMAKASTIIDVSLGVPRVLRDGGLPLADLKQACPILRF